jgi:multiple sugar transport system ATP-binding protein
MATIILADVSKDFPNGVRAVRNLNLEIVDGELIVLLGPSGCGKTTTLRLIAGLEQPTHGTIGIGGRTVNTVPPRERNVSFVFQRPVLYPQLTVRRNLSFALEMREGTNWRPWRTLLGMWTPWRADARLDPKWAGQIQTIAHQFGLEDVLDRRPDQLSGGQQQRVALGRAFVRAPAVFLLDEPLSNLDERLRAELRHELHLLQRRLGTTMVYVTHDQSEAMTLGDRLIVMDKGAIQQADRPMIVFERPHNRFVAGFVGSPRMNFIEGEVRTTQEGSCFVAEGLSWPLPPSIETAWGALAGRQVTLGLRPESVQFPRSGESRATLTMEVVLSEPLGRSWIVTLQRDRLQMKARLDRRPGLEMSQKVEVAFLLEDAYLFDRTTGLTLTGGRPAG